jgi:nitrate reductase gamma subunit
VVGGVIGGIAVVAVILGIILLWIQRKKRVDKSRRRERPKIRLVG